ncbi:uncharacterized protein LOC107036706 isoform X2 [Diachasma alloeum]|nr:uncharacterized protein LOC107036706 isoform X2 [Diachasma alloeum]
MAVVTAAAISLQLLSLPAADYEEESDKSCESGPFRKGLLECVVKLNRRDDLCPMEVLDWFLPDKKLDKNKMMKDVERHLKNPKYAEKTRKIFSECIETANAAGRSERAVANTFVHCWLQAGGSELSKKAFCRE